MLLQARAAPTPPPPAQILDQILGRIWMISWMTKR
jgi:hypothetical protein